MTVIPATHTDGCTFRLVGHFDASCPRCAALIVAGQRAAKARAERSRATS